MKTVYYDNLKIENTAIQKLTNSAFYSEIQFNNKTNKDIFKSILAKKGFILKNFEENISDKFFIISSSVFVNSSSDFNDFINFIQYSFYDVIYGNLDCFIFYGTMETFLNFKNGIKNNVRELPSFISDLSNFSKVEPILKNNFGSRHFNKIGLVNNVFTKESTNISKLESEYLFLKNIPKNLKPYYVEVFEFTKVKNSAKYSMKLYDYPDVSNYYLSNNLEIKFVEELTGRLYNYFIDSKTSHLNNKLSFEFILNKNQKRYDDLKKLNLYNDLNNFMISHRGLSINDHYERIRNELISFKQVFYNSSHILSHGDLCFSNILFSLDKKDLKLIDPRGVENEGFNSIYYDFAKLSHSFLGNYDLIINGKSYLKHDENMQVSICYEELKNFNEKNIFFYDLIEKLGINLKVIRILESSLFLSMLTLHTDNVRKLYMLGVRSYEVFDEYKKL